MSETKLYELVEALDKDKYPIDGSLPKGCRYSGALEKVIVVETNEDSSPSMIDRLERLREESCPEGIVVVVPSGTRFLKLREVEE